MFKSNLTEKAVWNRLPGASHECTSYSEQRKEVGRGWQSHFTYLRGYIIRAWISSGGTSFRSFK